LTAKLNQIFAQGEPFPAKILAVFPQGADAKLPEGIPVFPENIKIAAVSGPSSSWWSQLTMPFLAYLPKNAPYSTPLLDGLEKGTSLIRPWVPVDSINETDWVKQIYADLGWIST